MARKRVRKKKTASPKVAQAAVPAQTGPAITTLKILLVAWLLFYTSITLALVVDTWVHEKYVLCQLLGVTDCSKMPAPFLSAIHAMLGGVLGAGALGMVSFHRHASVEQDFHCTHGWGYVFAPWLAAVLALMVFALLQSGMLILTGGPTTGENPAVAQLGFLAIGFLSGFGWYDATEKILKLVKRMFAEGEDKAGARDDRDEVKTTTPGKSPASGARQRKAAVK